MKDPSLEHDNQCNESTPSTTPLPELDKDDQLQANHEVPVSTPPPNCTDHSPKSSSEKVPTTESPPTQLMERSDNSSYRIPSSVFSRTKSTVPGEWSTASNESLFSIHMETMSFTKDQLLWRSGELVIPEEPSTSGHMFSFSASPSPAHKSADSDKSHELGVVVETMKEVIRESAEGPRNEKLLNVEECKTHHPGGSGTSTTSFAFPVLTGELEKDASAKIDGPVTVEPEKPQPKALPKTETSAQPENPSKTEAPPQAESKTPAGNPNAAQSNWFSFLPCCRSSS